MSYLNTKANRRKLAVNRYRNARYVLFERCGGEVARFARAIQKSHSFTSAYIGESPTKRIGDKVAQTIALSFSLGAAWLDDDHSQSWDRRLREAIGGSVHPLDEHDTDIEPSHDLERWLASLTVMPGTGPDLLRLGRQSQQYLSEVQVQLKVLEEQRRDLLTRSARMYEQDLESRLLSQGYVVQSPSYNQGPLFRVWHSDSAIKTCLLIRVQLNFEPVLQLTPIPPAGREVVAVPFISDGKDHIQYLFLAIDERSAAFDATRLTWVDGALWLVGDDGAKQRDLTARLSLEPLFSSLLTR
ncbi:hypothetical protein [Echinimonas agarilytica]|uniref:Uncharacterized protein n=1 Tax=Echinimonas agarilytica TaxID=1215918 RepID=A0AA42B8L1_9GAMM|nr:hypothetical protein [Echinimonas agarilytica]MCM2681069.1 hypothetical protein [Echinimonas agarilytica]